MLCRVLNHIEYKRFLFEDCCAICYLQFEQETALQQCRADLNSAVKRFNSLKTMCPVAADVKKEIDAYKAFLDALEAKYAVG